MGQETFHYTGHLGNSSQMEVRQTSRSDSKELHPEPDGGRSYQVSLLVAVSQPAALTVSTSEQLPLLRQEHGVELAQHHLGDTSQVL